MKKFGRILLLVLGTMFGLFVVLLLAVNLYVQSQGTHARIERELTQRLGTELRLRTISVTPWGGLKLSGIVIPQANSDRNAQHFLDANTFQLRIHFPSLFQQRLVIKEVSLIEPQVVWPQNANGKWRLPRIAAAEEETAAAARPNESMTPPVIVAAPPMAPVAAAPETKSAVDTEPGAAAFQPEIRRVNLLHGRFHFLDQHARPVAAFDDVEFRSNFRNAADVRGQVTIAKTSIRERFFVEQLSARLVYGPSALELADVSANAGGGQITGNFAVQPQAPDSPFVVQLKFHGLQADRMVKEAGGPAETVAGSLDGFFDATGKTSDPNALAGSGEIVLRDGQLRQYNLLDALGQLLQIEELRQLKLDEAHVKYRVTPGVVMIDELVLHSPNMRLTGVGSIGFDGALRINSKLAINDRIRRQLFRGIRENFQPTQEEGFAAVNFDIGGTVERPTTNMMERIVGGDLKSLGNVINTLWGGKNEHPKKNKPVPAAAEATPSPNESATPSPST